MKSSEKNTVYTAEFVKDMQTDVAFFVEPSALKINKTKTVLYLNLYEYAFQQITDNEDAIIEIVKTESGYELLDHYKLLPPVADGGCPSDWIEIPIKNMPLSAFPQEDDINEIRSQIQKKWDSYAFLEDVIEGLISMIDSLERTGTEHIVSLVIVKEMKKYVVSRINTEKEYMAFEPVFVILEDVISDEDSIMEDAVIEFLKNIRDIADKRFKKLMQNPKETHKGKLPSIIDCDLGSLKKNFRKYDSKEFDEFLASLDGNSSEEDIAKAQYIKDNRITT